VLLENNMKTMYTSSLDMCDIMNDSLNKIGSNAVFFFKF
jgi:hypothetical protein